MVEGKDREGQVVLLSGEPGIGESRLTAALREHLATEPHTPLRYFCRHSARTAHFFRSSTRWNAPLGSRMATPLKQSSTNSIPCWRKVSRRARMWRLFADMLSLPNDERYRPTRDPQQRRRRTLEALTTQIKALAQQSPVLMIFEDAHWADPTSLEALGRAVDRIRALGVLLIVTYRPEFELAWIGRPHVTALTINRLAQRDVDAMIDRVIGNKLIPPNIRRDIIERTDGIPLFVGGND